jgi:hypothetical protein
MATFSVIFFFNDSGKFFFVGDFACNSTILHVCSYYCMYSYFLLSAEKCKFSGFSFWYGIYFLVYCEFCLLNCSGLPQQHHVTAEILRYVRIAFFHTIYNFISTNYRTLRMLLNEQLLHKAISTYVHGFSFRTWVWKRRISRDMVLVVTTHFLKCVILSSYQWQGCFERHAHSVIEKLILCVIWGFRRCLNEVLTPLWCYETLIASYRRFGKARLSHLQVWNRRLDSNELLLGTVCPWRRCYCGTLNVCKACCFCLSGSNIRTFQVPDEAAW